MNLVITDENIETALTYAAQLHINKQWGQRNSVLHVLSLFGVSEGDFDKAVEKRKSELKQFELDLKLIKNQEVEHIKVPKYVQLAGFYKF